MFKAILKWLGIVLLGAVVLGLVFVGYMWWRIPSDKLDPVNPGTLTLHAPGGQHKVGSLDVEVAANGIFVTRDRLTYWRSAGTVAPVTASVATVEYPEHFGYFWPQVNRSKTYTDMSIDTIAEQAGSLKLTGTLSSSKGGSDTLPVTITLSEVAKPGAPALHIDVDVPGATSVMLVSGLDNEARVHGLGEQYAPFDLSGRVIPILPREQGLGRGDQPLSFLADLTNWAAGDLTTSYAPFPAYVTSENRALTLDNVDHSGALAIADLTRRDQIALESFAPRISAQAMAAKDPLSLMAARSAGVTRPELAEWTQDGAILGLQGGTDRVRKIVDDMLAAGVPVKGVWLQDWTGKRVTSFGDRLWWTWELDEKRYPGWKEMVADFNAKGIKVLNYINTWLVDASEKGEPGLRNLFKEAEEKGYLVKQPDGSPYQMDQNGFDATLVDLTNPAARDWYADVIAKDVLTGAGSDGFMADFGEALPYDGVLANGKATEQHNRWPFLWSETVREGCKRAGKPDCMTFMRSGALGVESQTPIMWAGDQMVTFDKGDGLISAIHGINQGGVSGFPLWHSDIGGYTSLSAGPIKYVRSEDLNERWTEMAAFGPIMRTHEGNRPAANAQVYDTPESRKAFARMVKLFVALKDYRAGVIEEAVKQGIPAQRHSWLVYPDSKAEHADEQFFLGSSLLVAPVIEQGATSVKVTFPPGTWTHILTGETFEGDREVEVQAPLGTPAAFVKQGDPAGDKIIAAVKAAGL